GVLGAPPNPLRRSRRNIGCEKFDQGGVLRTKSRLVSVAAVLAVLGLTATALAATNPGSQVKTRKVSLGTILVDSKGKTLYMFAKDKSGKSSCSGACATYWPPYMTTGKPTAGPGAKASL